MRQFSPGWREGGLLGKAKAGFQPPNCIYSWIRMNFKMRLGLEFALSNWQPKMKWALKAPEWCWKSGSVNKLFSNDVFSLLRTNRLVDGVRLCFGLWCFLNKCVLCGHLASARWIQARVLVQTETRRKTLAWVPISIFYLKSQVLMEPRVMPSS
jgi:hypothetical protein